MIPTCTSQAAIRSFESTGTMAGSRFWRELGNLASAVMGNRQAWLVLQFRVSQWIRTETFDSRTARVGASASWNVQFRANEWVPYEGFVASQPPPRLFQPLQLRVSAAPCLSHSDGCHSRASRTCCPSAPPPTPSDSGRSAGPLACRSSGGARTARARDSTSD